jgi:hypothetical protein
MQYLPCTLPTLQVLIKQWIQTLMTLNNMLTLCYAIFSLHTVHTHQTVNPNNTVSHPAIPQSAQHHCHSYTAGIDFLTYSSIPGGFDKAESNALFCGKHICNNLISIRVSLICKLSRTPDYGATAPRSRFSLPSVLSWICWTHLHHPKCLVTTQLIYKVLVYKLWFVSADWLGEVCGVVQNT